MAGDGLCRRRRDGRGRRAEGGQDAAGPVRVRGAVEMGDEARKREEAVAMAPLLLLVTRGRGEARGGTEEIRVPELFAARRGEHLALEMRWRAPQLGWGILLSRLGRQVQVATLHFDQKLARGSSPNSCHHNSFWLYEL